MSIVLTAGVVWLIAAFFIARRPGCPQIAAGRVALVVTGVPLLGYATYELGPLVGLAGLLLGAGVLLRCTLPRGS